MTGIMDRNGEVRPAAASRLTSAELALESARARLLAQGEVEVPALGLSMGEGFDGAEALVIGRCAGRPRVGDVAVFERAGRWVAHRVLVCGFGHALTAGDALWGPDWPPCRSAAVEGVVVAVVQAGRRSPVARSRARAWRGLGRALAWWLNRARRR